MTGRELLEKKGVKFLFRQKGYDYYSFGYRFYKLDDIDTKAIPVDIEKGLVLDIDDNEIYDINTGKTIADISFKDVLDKVMEGEEK